SDTLWRRRFHADPLIVDKNITLNGSPRLVIGVLPAGFRFPRATTPIGTSTGMKPEIIRPIAIDRSKLRPSGSFNFVAIGRLRPGIGVRQASAELNTVQAALTKEIATSGIELRADVTGLQEQIVGGSRRGLLVLVG